MKNKISRLIVRLSEVEEALAQPGVFDHPKKYRELTQEHSYLSEIKNAWEELEKYQKQLEEDRTLLKSEKNQEICALLEEEIPLLEEKVARCENRVETLLVPPDPDDSRNIIMEIRAGTGGDEAALFVGLFEKLDGHFHSGAIHVV